MAKSKRDYGLPLLTFEEAARVLAVDVDALKLWAFKTMSPSASEWSKWTRAKRRIPETMIRLYLSEARPRDSSYEEKFQELLNLKAEMMRLAEELRRYATKARTKASRRHRLPGQKALPIASKALNERNPEGGEPWR